MTGTTDTDNDQHGQNKEVKERSNRYHKYIESRYILTVVSTKYLLLMGNYRTL